MSEEKQSLAGAKSKSCSWNLMNQKENPEREIPTALVIDDIIDDFELEAELKEDSVMDTDNVDLAGTHFSGAKSSGQNSEKEQDSARDCYTDDVEEGEEEEEEEEMEEEVNDDEEYVQPNENKGKIFLFF